MQRNMYKTFALIGVLATGACSSVDPIYRNFNSEAGATIDSGSFGNSTMNNTMAMTNRSGFVIDMSRRFSQEVSPMVNFAFNSAELDAGRATRCASRQLDPAVPRGAVPRLRAHRSGRLDRL